MTIASLDNISKTFRQGFWGRKNQVLNGLSLSLQAGEVYGFLGHNGAGKSTTMKIMVGLLRADGGKVRLFDQDAHSHSVRHRIGFLSDDIGVYPHLSAPEMLQLAAELFRIPAAKARHMIPERLASVGLADVGNRKIRHFSKGMRQRLGVAVALLNDPDLLLLDEPYSGLDPVGRKEIRELLMELKHAGKTIMLSSHIVPDVEAVCDRVGILSDGRITRELDLNEMYSTGEADVDVTITNNTRVPVMSADYGAKEILRNDQLTILRCRGYDRVRRLIDDVHTADGTVIEVKPMRLSLEDIFVDVIERAPGRKTREHQETVGASSD